MQDDNLDQRARASVAAAGSNDNAVRLPLPDEAATLALGGALARVLQPGLVIFLAGDLGAGKTTLVRGLLRGLGFEGRVKSPTYTLVELYAISGLNLYHFDFYRLEQPEEFLEAGLDEYFQSDGVCLIEWPARAGKYLPKADLLCELAVCTHGRRASVRAGSEPGCDVLRCLKQSLLGAANSSSSP